MWNGGDEPQVAGRNTLLHQGAESAYEVDARIVCGPVQGFGHGDEVIGPAAFRYYGDWGDRDALVDDGDAVQALYGFGCADQVFGA